MDFLSIKKIHAYIIELEGIEIARKNYGGLVSLFNSMIALDISQVWFTVINYESRLDKAENLTIVQSIIKCSK